jgi:predicted enzyme related to lactoylglutathione lyase
MASLVLVLDCTDPDSLQPFWTEALDYRAARSPDPDRYAVMVPREGVGPPMLLQRVPEPKSGKNRMHVDLHTDDLEAETQRLIALGATRTSDDVITDYGLKWLTLADPQGNEFCVVQDPVA